jgi:uncharacterized phage protein (TIGR02218 family)
MTKAHSQDFIDKDEGIERQPAELYRIWRDGGTNWRYTSGDVAVVFGGYTYTPVSIKRSEIQSDSKLDVTKCEISVAHITEPAKEFISLNPVEILWISIMKIHRDMDPLEASVVFLGQIKSVSFQGVAAKVLCVGFEYYLSQPIPKERYQVTCNNTLFDTRCSLNAASYKTTTTVTVSADGLTLTNAVFGTKADTYFAYGKVKFGDYWRTITGHSGSVITLKFPITTLETGDTVDVYPGCDGFPETCRDKFASTNILNCFAFPYIPEDNPATWM